MSSNRQENHRIYIQLFAISTTPTSPKQRGDPPSISSGTSYSNRSTRTATRFVAPPSTTTVTSAAVRLTPKAKTKDLCRLLRGKFGLPPISVEDDDDEEEGEVDALILVGTFLSPKGYVEFEHEKVGSNQVELDEGFDEGFNCILLEASPDPTAHVGRLEEEAASVTTGGSRSSRMAHHREDLCSPFHVVRTLRSHERPLDVRNAMLASLSKRSQCAQQEMGKKVTDESRSLILKWHFVPGSVLGVCNAHNSTPKMQAIPSFVDLEDYCSEVEEMDDEPGAEADDGITSSNQLTLTQERRSIELLSNLNDPFASSGFLLLQSSNDPFVWRRVFVVLTDDYLWYIQRRKPLKLPNLGEMPVRVGRHRKISLHGTLLDYGSRGHYHAVKVNEESKFGGYFSSSLGSRMPNTFRVVSNESTLTFRAFSSESYRVWLRSISDRISQQSCNCLMDLASVIAEEETRRRQIRPLQVVEDSNI